MPLSSSQRKKFTKDLLEGYPTWPDLTIMVSQELEKNLEQITSKDQGLEHCVHALIQKAEAQGWIDELVKGAHMGNPGNSKLKDFYQRYTQSQPVQLGEPQVHSEPPKDGSTLPHLPTASEEKPGTSQSQTQSDAAKAPLPVEEVIEHPATPPSPVGQPPRESPVAPPVAPPDQEIKSASDEALDLARKHIDTASKHFQAAKGLFAKNGNIRLLQCPGSIRHLKKMSQSLEYLSTLLHTNHTLPRLITSRSQQYMIALDRIKELTQTSIEAIKDFRPYAISSKSATISQAVSKAYDDLAQELDRVVEIFHP